MSSRLKWSDIWGKPLKFPLFINPKLTLNAHIPLPTYSHHLTKSDLDFFYKMSYSVSPPEVFWLFHKWLWIFNQFFTHLLHVPIYELDYTFLFNYFQLWQSYAILSATTQSAFCPMVDIFSIWSYDVNWVVTLNMA